MTRHAQVMQKTKDTRATTTINQTDICGGKNGDVVTLNSPIAACENTTVGVTVVELIEVALSIVPIVVDMKPILGIVLIISSSTLSLE